MIIIKRAVVLLAVMHSLGKRRRSNEVQHDNSTIGMRTHGPRQPSFNRIRFFIDVISV